MTTLRELQTVFREHLLRPDTAMQTYVVDAGRTDTATRLAVYSDAYRIRLLEGLDANYPALHKWLGDREFCRLGEAYLEARPSQHYSIRWFGHLLPAFMAHTTPWNEQPFACELAEFEWAMSEAFDAADADSIGFDRIATLAPAAWAGLRLTFHPSLRRLPLFWNVPPIWQALTRDETPDTPERTTTAAPWIVWRRALALYYRPLDIDEARALDTARDGTTFAALCERLCEWIDAEHVAMRAAGFLQQWVQDGLIADIET